MTVQQFIDERGLVHRISAALAREGVPELPRPVADLPVKSSHAVRRLGSYEARGPEPVAIRLQFALEETVLVETFLHELAHCLDHVFNQRGTSYRRAHGAGWRRWATVLGIAPRRCGESEVLNRLHRQRLKVVAVCRRCGFEVRRLRRLDRNRRYIHPECGGRLRHV